MPHHARVVRWISIIISLLGVTPLYADLPLPIAEGTTWRYAHAEEPSDNAAGGAANEDIVVRIAGTEEWQGKRLLKLETLSGPSVTKTELVEISDRGIFCHGRKVRGEEMAKVDPPETWLSWPLRAGATWDSGGLAADLHLREHWTVLPEEDVYVPAGKFHAVKLHCDGTALMAVSIDRWFVAGVGFVREVTTMRSPGGMLLQRSTVELAKPPEVLPLPTPTPSPSATPTPTPTATPEPSATADATPAAPSTRLTVEVSADPAGGMQTEFKSDVKNIYVRWHGHGLPKDARVKVSWVAEDVGDLVDPNFIVDETESVAPSPDASARFTLGRPEDGWAEGKYRVEFYINGELEHTVRVRIVR